MAQQRQTVLRDRFDASPLFARKCWHGKDDTAEGWGDEISQYYVVEDMLKLPPGQILFLLEGVMEGGRGMEVHDLYDHHRGDGGVWVSRKTTIEAYVAGLGEWFENNGETCGETVAWILDGRGEDVGAVKEEVAGGGLGICRL